MKKIAALVLSMAMLLGILSGCGSKGTSAAGSSSAPKKDVVFTFSRQADMNTWNTFMGTDTNSVLLGKLIYDTLIVGDRKGSFSPSLATSWTPSADYLTWTLKLRSDVKFHNGDQFSSADVKYTIERFAKDKTTRSMNDWTLLDSIETPDATTAVFKFTQPMGTFLNAIMDTYIVDKKVMDAQGDKSFDKPNGTGPWKFVSWTAGQQTIFERNDSYWNWGSNKSNVDKIIFKPIKEDTTRLAAIQTGDADLVEALNSDQGKQLGAVKGIKVENVPSSVLANFQFKFENSIFADAKVRQAASLAINRQQIVDTIAGGGKAQAWMCVSSDLGYKDVAPVYDPAKAKQLLSESTYKGQEFKILAVTGQLPRSTEILQAISSMLNAVGFKSSVQFMESAALAAQRQGGNYDCYIVSGATSAGEPTR